MHRLANVLRTGALMVLPAAVVAAVSVAVLGTGPGAWVFALVCVCLVVSLLHVRAGTVALQAMRAYPVSPAQASDLHRLVAELSVSAGHPMPRLYLSPTVSPNAFAAGRTPASLVLCATTGLLEGLAERELRAVLARILVDVHTGNAVPASFAAALANAVMFPAGSASAIRAASRHSTGSAFPVHVRVLRLVAAALVRLVASPARTGVGDQKAAQLVEDPEALARALGQIAAGTRQASLPQERRLVAAAHLMVVDPFGSSSEPHLLTPRPSTGERIASLRTLPRPDLTGTRLKGGAQSGPESRLALPWRSDPNGKDFKGRARGRPKLRR